MFSKKFEENLSKCSYDYKLTMKKMKGENINSKAQTATGLWNPAQVAYTRFK